MTSEDTPADDGPDESEDVGGFQFGMADGSGEATESGPRRTAGAGSGGSRFDFQSWVHENVPGLGGSSSGGPDEEGTETAPEATVGPADFAGFDFGRWLQETEVRAPTSTEPDAPTAAASETPIPGEADGEVETILADEEVPDSVEAGRAYEGFDFRQWMTDEEVGPEKPPESARVVGSESSASERSALAGLVAALPFAGGQEAGADTYEGGFDFVGWLGEGDSEFFEPVEFEAETAPATAEPSPTPEPGTTATATAAGSAGVGETPEFPTPGGGGGLSDAPPVKMAAFALFTAAIVAVALTAAGAIAPFGPADGFGASSGGDDANQQAAATNNSTATATPTATPEPTQEDTPTETEEPTPTPTEEPTPTPTETPTPTPTETPTETENGSDDDDDGGGILDPLPIGSSSSSDDGLLSFF